MAEMTVADKQSFDIFNNAIFHDVFILDYLEIMI